MTKKGNLLQISYGIKNAVEVVSLYSVVKNVEYILRHARYAEQRENQKDISQLCPLEAELNKALFTDLFTELADVHSSKYIHIGGDEAYLFGDCKREIRMIFAAAPSQNEMLEHLIKSSEVDWGKVVAFHMDEYIGLQKGASQLFSSFLMEKIFSHVPFKEINLIDSNSSEDECKRYSKLIDEATIDIVCMGIGENGHIAFNDPPVADFRDPVIMKKVKLDNVCRQQQVNNGCFSTFDSVPEYAYTLTIPTLMNGAYLFCVVPGDTKKDAVFQTLYNPEITKEWPSTVLRKHNNCRFYFDINSYKQQYLNSGPELGWDKSIKANHTNARN